jgi:hypothetical protein
MLKELKYRSAEFDVSDHKELILSAQTFEQELVDPLLFGYMSAPKACCDCHRVTTIGFVVPAATQTFWEPLDGTVQEITLEPVPCGHRRMNCAQFPRVSSVTCSLEEV